MANYNVDYTDKRFTQVAADRNRDLNDNAEMYGEMMERSDAFYDAQIEASKNWADKQAEIQQEQTDFAIEKIEQQKEQANKDYIKEQSAAYVDWQKQSDQYGAEAEKRAVQGLAGTGYSESSLVSMYNTYQNRVSNAREAYLKAVQNYDNAMTEARLQNNAVLAELAAQALEQQLSLALEGFQYKNTLLIEKQNRADRIKDRFDTRWQNVLQQINAENALKEQARQFDVQMQFDRDKLEAEQNSYKNLLIKPSTEPEDFDYLMLTDPSDPRNIAASWRNPVDPVDAIKNFGSGATLAVTYDALKSLAKAGASKSELTSKINQAVKDKILTVKEANSLKKSLGL